jgi:predicted nucleotidyltransferase
MAMESLPQQRRQLVETLVDQLGAVPGMAAIVLGGSYARLAHHPASDIDLGLYYSEEEPFSIDDVRRIANDAQASGTPTVTDFYQWGPWVNGGAWIHTHHGKVDFIYRNIDQVQRTIGEAKRGVVHHDFDQQPTYGFYSVIYLAETEICIPLFDPALHIAGLKQQVRIYPPELKRSIVANSLWGAEFTLLFARDYAAQGDVYNAVGCLTRVLSGLTQALFAMNEKYYIGDKKVMETVAAFKIVPPGYTGQVKHILASPGGTAAQLSHTIDSLELIWQRVTGLASEFCQPAFNG